MNFTPLGFILDGRTTVGSSGDSTLGRHHSSLPREAISISDEATDSRCEVVPAEREVAFPDSEAQEKPVFRRYVIATPRDSPGWSC
jgi:hypothetical protein